MGDGWRTEGLIGQQTDPFPPLFEQADAGMAMLTLAGRLVRVNKALASLVERDRAGLVGCQLTDLVDDEQRHAVGRTVRQVAGGTAAIGVAHGLAGRSLAWLDTTLALVRDSDSESAPPYLFMQTRDIREQRQTYARTERAFGPTSRSRRCATSPASWWASRRSFATSPNVMTCWSRPRLEGGSLEVRPVELTLAPLLTQVLQDAHGVEKGASVDDFDPQTRAGTQEAQGAPALGVEDGVRHHFPHHELRVGRQLLHLPVAALFGNEQPCLRHAARHRFEVAAQAKRNTHNSAVVVDIVDQNHSNGHEADATSAAQRWWGTQEPFRPPTPAEGGAAAGRFAGIKITQSSDWARSVFMSRRGLPCLPVIETSEASSAHFPVRSD